MTVTLHELTIRYGPILAVDSISVEFPTGAAGLLGRNGAGKSSVLRALLGLVRPTDGSTEVLGLGRDAKPVEVRRFIGYMPERDTHVPLLNGYETVRLAAELSGLPRLEASRRAHEVLYLVGLEEQRYRPVSGYSLGMRQKTKLATALVHDPRVLFLDEPTNGLDPAGRREMLQLIKQLGKELDKSIILSSHILQDVESVCDNVVLLEKGRVLAAGGMQELTKTETRDLHVRLDGERAALEQGLRAAGVLAVHPEDGDRYRLTLPEELPVAEVFLAVQNAGGTVRQLRQHRRTLEEVFLGAVRDAGDGDGTVGEGAA
ncbi:MAG: ABC transporter ATP-binding protein [Planctomycetota bacterium]|jgi:ABC-2 type transport system ATP-binding protein